MIKDIDYVDQIRNSPYQIRGWKLCIDFEKYMSENECRVTSGNGCSCRRELREWGYLDGKTDLIRWGYFIDWGDELTQ